MNQLPKSIEALILDFDGVFTDNKVIVMQDGTEAVVCHRGDGMGIEMLHKKKIPILVISREENIVVKTRCEKLRLECVHGIKSKKELLEKWLKERNIQAANTIYLGNDINDIDSMKYVGCGIAVHDAHEEVLKIADLVLNKTGGNGAVRELCDRILANSNE